MAGSWTDSIPAVGNQISTDIGAIENNFEILQDAIAEITYGWSNTSVADLRTSTGHIRGLYVEYKDGDEIYVSGGDIDIHDGTSVKRYYCLAQLTKSTGALAASTVYYVYVDPPDSGQVLIADDIEVSTTKPTFSHANHGWYHTSSTDQRFIGSFTSTSGSVVTPFIRSEDGHRVYYDFQTVSSCNDDAIPAVANIATLTFSTVCPSIENALINLTARMTYVTANAGYGYLLKYDSGRKTAFGMVTGTSSSYTVNTLDVPVDSSARLQWYADAVGANGTIHVNGYWEPR